MAQTEGGDPNISRPQGYAALLRDRNGCDVTTFVPGSEKATYSVVGGFLLEI